MRPLARSLLSAMLALFVVGLVALPAFADPPVAADDDFGTTPEDTSVTADVLGNDTDVDTGDTLAVEAVGDPGHGTVTDNGDGTITYDPARDFHGSDSFTYTVSDGHGGTDDAIVSVAVSSVNDAPVANDDPSYAVTHDQPLAVNAASGILANDADADLDGLTATLGDDAGHGDLTLHAMGSFEYQPDAGFVGTDTFTYTAFDGAAQSAPATATITVSDQAPASSPDSYPEGLDPFLEDGTLNVDAPGVLGNDADDDGDAITAAEASGPSHGDLTLNPDGSFSYTPDADFEGQDSFTYAASDSVGGTGSPVMVTIAVTGTEDVPTANDDSVSTPEDTSVEITVLANDSDPDAGDTLTVDLPTSTASEGALTVDDNGVVTYTPAQNFHGSDAFDYSIDDGHGGTAIASVHVTVTPVNDAPVGATDSYRITSSPFSAASLLANDDDVDSPTLTVAGFTQPTLGHVTLNHVTGTFTYTPNAGVCQKTDGFTYRVSDGSLLSPPVSVTLTVQIPKTSVTLTVAPSATVVAYKGSVTVTAAISAFSRGAKLTIFRTPIGGAPIMLVTHAPNAQGKVSYGVTGVQKRNTFTASSKFDNCHAPAASPGKVVQVRAGVTTTLTGGKLVNGVRTYPGVNPFYSTKVLPLHPGATVHWVWQVRRGSTWKDYFTPTVTLDGQSHAAFGLAGWTANVLNRIRSVGPFDANGQRLPDNVPGTSKWLLFRVNA